MKFKRYILLMLTLLMVNPSVMAHSTRDDDDKDPSIRPGIRRLHPERERAKAIKKLQEQLSHKAEVKDDPWDTTDEVWGTVDLPPVAAKDSAAVEGYRLSTGTDALMGGHKRLTWKDEPVTATLEQLSPYVTIEGGECRSRYVSGDSLANEVYFAFAMSEDSIPGPMRLCVNYCGDRPLDFDQVVFTVDGFDYTFYPMDTRSGKGLGGAYWSSSDDELKPAYRDLVYALTHGTWVMIKLQSMGGVSRVKVVDDGQRDDFAKTFAFYRLLGGTI